MGEGLMCYPMGSTADGRYGAHILLAPPFIVDANHVEEIPHKLDKALDNAISSL